MTLLTLCDVVDSSYPVFSTIRDHLDPIAQVLLSRTCSLLNEHFHVRFTVNDKPSSVMYRRVLKDLFINKGCVFAKYTIPMNSNSDAPTIIGPVVYTSGVFFTNVVIADDMIDDDGAIIHELDVYDLSETTDVSDRTRCIMRKIVRDVVITRSYDKMSTQVTLRDKSLCNMARLCKSLKDELLRFIDAIEAIFDDHDIPSSDIAYVRVFIMQLSPDASMMYVIDKILPYEDEIEKRDESFFYDNPEIFGKLPKSKVNYFSDLVQSGELTQDDKDEIWEFFSSFIAYGKEYDKKHAQH